MSGGDPGIGRRHILAGLVGGAAVLPVAARAQGATDALVPNAAHDQSVRLQEMLDAASAEDAELVLPAGRYLVSGLFLPRATRLRGVPGATVLAFSGGGFLMLGESVEHVSLEGIVFEGSGLPIGDAARALVRINGAARLAIRDCTFEHTAATGLWLERASGRVERCTVRDCGEAAIYALDSAGLAIAGNDVSDCADNGILVHRSEPGADGTLVTGNRIARIGARSGGTGQNGNGINVFRADGVGVSDNHVSDCAFSAIRGNAASNIRIAGNTCLASGETAIFSEFAFEGAVITGNLVDGAAHGINVVNLNEGGRLATVTGNLVRNLKPDAPYPPELMGFGVGISVEADAAVSGNTVENAPVCGISIGWGPYMRNVAVTGNMVRGAPKGIVVTVADGAGAALIASNLVADTPDGAIVAHRWEEAASGDLVDGGAEECPGLTVAGNRRV